MNLEDIEQQCLTYLRQVSNPIVPVRTLLNYLHQNEEWALLGEGDLLAFLRGHDDVRVLESPLGEEAGLHGVAEAGPRVILKARVPTAPEMTALVDQQLADMTKALERALQEAAARGDKQACDRIAAMLRRAAALRDSARKLL